MDKSFFKPTVCVGDVVSTYKESVSPINIKLAGRVLLKRLMGGACFFNVQDFSGVIQVFVNKKLVNDSCFCTTKHLNIGDIVGVSGFLKKTKKGELTIFADYVTCITKTLRKYPDKWNKITNKDFCYKKRYLDLIVNDLSCIKFKLRIILIQFIRNFFIERNFYEVETPMLHNISSGACAKPFVTYHNTAKTNLFLRVAPELYLKKLIIGGFTKVFELNRSFRNEGVSKKHNPEFTMLEFYQAYSTYEDLMCLTADFLRKMSKHLVGCYNIEYNGTIINFEKQFEKLSFIESLLMYNSDLTQETVSSRDILVNLLEYKSENFSKDITKNLTICELQVELFSSTVEKNLIQPTFIVEYPIEISPLAKRNEVKFNFADRFELYIAGFEIANGYSELVDPVDQENRFKEQLLKKKDDITECTNYDISYVEALEYGMPPTAGEGFGVDRLVMLFTNSKSIRDVILFPSVK